MRKLVAMAVLAAMVAACASDDGPVIEPREDWELLDEYGMFLSWQVGPAGTCGGGYDRGRDDVLDYSWTTKRTDHRVETLMESTGDGVPDVAEVAILDDAGRPLSFTQDELIDGYVEHTFLYRYDDAGRLHDVSVREGERAVELRTFRHEGVEIIEERDQGMDGTIELRRVVTRDAQGRLESIESDGDALQGADGRVDERIEYTWRTEGPATVNTLHPPFDGVRSADAFVTYHYDEQGRPTGTDMRTPGGQMWRNEGKTYDHAGRLWQRDEVRDPNQPQSPWNFTVLYRYDCE